MLISYAHLFHLWPYAERQPNSSDKPRKMFQTSPKNIMFRCHQELLLCELPSKKFLLRTSKQKLLCAKSSSAENRPEPAELSAKKQNLELRFRSHKRSLRLMSSGDLFGAISSGRFLEADLLMFACRPDAWCDGKQTIFRTFGSFRRRALSAEGRLIPKRWRAHGDARSAQWLWMTKLERCIWSHAVALTVASLVRLSSVTHNADESWPIMLFTVTQLGIFFGLLLASCVYLCLRLCVCSFNLSV